ncbi:MAG: amidohydrolase family protein [Planctomycetes bacterium]|nr:amidohydrolase family protein [Planctomycetota bacterium]
MRAAAFVRLLLAAAAFAAAAPAQDPAVPSRTFAVRCGTLLLGDGKAPLRDAWLVVVDGKVRSVGMDAPPAGTPVVDASGRVVMPGIVAADSDLANAADSEYQFAPDALAVDQFDFERSQLAALQGGVTTAYLSPGRARLVGGQGAVVKLAGSDLVARVLDDSAALRVNFAEAALNAPRVFEPTPHPTDEDPLEAARIQTPTARISVLAELRAAFAAATDKDLRAGGEGPAEHRFDERPLADVIKGALPLRAGAFLANDIRRALLFQQELGVRMVLEDPQEIAEVIDLAAAQKVAATFRVPVRFGRANPGGEDRLDKSPEPRADAAAKAAAKGLLVGLAPAPGVPLRDYLMAVAVAVRHGLPAATALRAVGADAAAILGVDGRVGTLQPGKDADFIVLSGDPLAVGTLVEQTWVDGERAYARKASSTALAIRAGLIHDGVGRSFRNGVVLMQDGRVKAVGEDLAIPYGAQVVDLPTAVVTPGLIDAFSHLGLAGEGMFVPPGAPNQRVHDAIAHDDPMFAPALREGITTVLVAGKDGGPVSGRLAAVKTGAADHASMTVRPIAGLRMSHDAIGPDAIRGFAEQLNRGKQYVEAWKKHEKDLADWQAGKKAESQPAPAPAPTEDKPEAAPVDPVSGVWEGDLDVQGQIQLKFTLDLKLDGTKVDGTIKISFAGREVPAQPIAGGSFEGGKLKIEFRGMGGSATLEGTIKDDVLTSKITLGRMGDQDLIARRISKSSGAPAPRRASASKPDEDGKPKAPKVDEGLEPMRAAIEKKAALVVRCNRGAAIGDVVELLEKEGIPYVLTGVEDLYDDAAPLKGRKPAVLVGPETVFEDKGELKNVASMLADMDLPVLFGSGECKNAKLLPLHAAYSVRYGLSPADALAGMSSATARAFRLDDRVGSLQKGKDADLVAFSGNPFEPQSRVLVVVCNGRIVVDRREEKQ